MEPGYLVVDIRHILNYWEFWCASFVDDKKTGADLVAELLDGQAIPCPFCGRYVWVPHDYYYL